LHPTNSTKPLSPVRLQPNATAFTINGPKKSYTLRRAFSAILNNYNGMTAYICRRFIPSTAFLVKLLALLTDLLTLTMNRFVDVLLLQLKVRILLIALWYILPEMESISKERCYQSVVFSVIFLLRIITVLYLLYQSLDVFYNSICNNSSV